MEMRARYVKMIILFSLGGLAVVAGLYWLFVLTYEPELTEGQQKSLRAIRSASAEQAAAIEKAWKESDLYLRFMPVLFFLMALSAVFLVVGIFMRLPVRCPFGHKFNPVRNWECPDCKKINNRHLLLPCQHCGEYLYAYKCPECGWVFELKDA